MKEEQMNVTIKMEDVDTLLRNMGTTMQMVSLGIENMAGGDHVFEMLEHFRNTVQDARALLDDARSTIIRKQLTA